MLTCWTRSVAIMSRCQMTILTSSVVKSIPAERRILSHIPVADASEKKTTTKWVGSSNLDVVSPQVAACGIIAVL